MTQPHAVLRDADWRHHITAWQVSGLTQADYCKKNGLIAHTFWYWKNKLTGAPSSVPSVPASAEPFIPVAIMDAPVSSHRIHDSMAVSKPVAAAISVHIGAGCHIDLQPGFDPATLRQALAILRE